jgi:C-terminal processing protease CtpA/Prc
VLGADSNAAGAGLKIGDAITAIDGRDVRGFGPGAIHYLLARPAGTAVSLLV